jgi:hypothetical protein
VEILELDRLSKAEGFETNLSRRSLGQVKILKGKVLWEEDKVLPMYVLNNVEVKRYFRVFFKVTLGKEFKWLDEYTIDDMTTTQLAAIVGLQSFSMDIGEDTYVKFFGDFDEKEFEDDEQD